MTEKFPGTKIPLPASLRSLHSPYCRQLLECATWLDPAGPLYRTLHANYGPDNISFRTGRAEECSPGPDNSLPVTDHACWSSGAIVEVMTASSACADNLRESQREHPRECGTCVSPADCARGETCQSFQCRVAPTLESAPTDPACAVYLGAVGTPHRAFRGIFDAGGACWSNGLMLRKKCAEICAELSNRPQPTKSGRQLQEVAIAERIWQSLATKL